ncbi:MAG TPA: Zn-ribbon domain-containing OB-fold protein [Patescibacteria group bacterium]|nr:Zn-ribbon domain-containing OB-fold protein [Patescibacteria group bacterium]
MSSEIARNWRLKKQRYRLVGEICENGHYVFPPRDICPDCHGEAHIPHTMSGKGEVYSSTVIYEAPAGCEEFTPYQVAIVKLEEGPMITAQLTDLPDAKKPVEIGTKVEMVTRKLKTDGDKGLITYGYKFRPSFATEASTSSK